MGPCFPTNRHLSENMRADKQNTGHDLIQPITDKPLCVVLRVFLKLHMGWSMEQDIA